MPNPSILRPINEVPVVRPPPDPGKGILATIDRDCVGHGMRALPAAATVSAGVMKVELETNAGRVRITYERWKYRHYRNTHWSWRAVHAELAPEHEEGSVVVTTQPEPAGWPGTSGYSGRAPGG